MSHSKTALWDIYIRKNPHWETENITLTPAGLKKLVEQTHDHGVAHGKAISSVKSGASDNLYNDAFKDMFKNKW